MKATGETESTKLKAAATSKLTAAAAKLNEAHKLLHEADDLTDKAARAANVEPTGTAGALRTVIERIEEVIGEDDEKKQSAPKKVSRVTILAEEAFDVYQRVAKEANRESEEH